MERSLKTRVGLKQQYESLLARTQERMTMFSKQAEHLRELISIEDKAIAEQLSNHKQ